MATAGIGGKPTTIVQEIVTTSPGQTVYTCPANTICYMELTQANTSGIVKAKSVDGLIALAQLNAGLSFIDGTYISSIKRKSSDGFIILFPGDSVWIDGIAANYSPRTRISYTEVTA